MKLIVNKDVCIGCGACQAICPDVFEIGDDGLATTIVDEISEDIKDDAIDAKEGCPVAAIEDAEEQENDEEQKNDEKQENDEEQASNEE